MDGTVDVVVAVVLKLDADFDFDLDLEDLAVDEAFREDVDEDANDVVDVVPDLADCEAAERLSCVWKKGHDEQRRCLLSLKRF